MRYGVKTYSFFYLHADYCNSEVRPTEINSQSTQSFKNMVNVLRDIVLHGRKAEFLLQWLLKINRFEKLQNPWNGISIPIYL